MKNTSSDWLPGYIVKMAKYISHEIDHGSHFKVCPLEAFNTFTMLYTLLCSYHLHLVLGCF